MRVAFVQDWFNANGGAEKVAGAILNICYCHTPLRPIWDMYDDYAASHSLGRTALYRAYIRYLRRWDIKTAGAVHYFVANSRHIQERIQKSYGRESTVIYPPVRVE